MGRIAPTVVVYLGFILALSSAVVLVRPFGSFTRRGGLMLAALALLLVIIGMAWPTREVRVARPATQLDSVMPRYQFSEFHQRHVQGTPAEVMRAIEQVTADEIRFFRLLVAIRRGGRAGAESILNPTRDTPILDVATRTTFIQLARGTNEIVIGTTVVAPEGAPPARTVDEFGDPPTAGYANAAMNFRVQPTASGSLVTTETRVHANDAASRRRFAAYWRVIYPGSALIRRSWLRAIAKRVENNANRKPDTQQNGRSS